jgi:hypothetical protein
VLLLCSTLAAGFGLAGAAANALRRPAGWRLFRRALRVSLFGTQFFRFHDVQVAGIAGLALNLALLGAVEFMIRRGAPAPRATPPGG